MLPQPAAQPTLIQSLQRGMQLVESVSAQGPLTARALSDATGIVLPTTYHLLRTLVHEGYLHRCSDGRYALGEQFASVTQLERRARGLRMIREQMAELAASGRVSVSLAALCNDEIVVTQFVAHPCAPRFECWPGMVVPGHATAIGKAILARMGPDQRAGYLARHPLEVFTGQTVTTSWRLEEDLSASHPIHSDQQFRYGISCAAVPLKLESGIAALGATYSSTRAARFRDGIDELLVDAANRTAEAMELTAPTA
ncbi:helix-turn-helix domain-containing protein [Mycobacterium sp. CVI_P3]|uniref:Helix-turn-helix domain-containing protein n=1 Tax=Mycobacterium pinniadriaticum TaxID=2994102 RepID=A0ABT3SD19_9MYCO|nr:helix-turn-helix domain-containing protein [Mycobacterium pinniadriaticum]MCX2930848.1 helix-turn-helix domain-containing protein [Mycobacterium pinniadriaticum]MCX2937272.1 helix-turn-helix domain-containing protein [Mycobacterium pinniadriaticum]